MNLKTLQRLIDRSVKAHNAAHSAATALNDYCEKHYFCAPGDVDAEVILDNCYGGCGISDGMTAEEFVRQMDERLECKR